MTKPTGDAEADALLKSVAISYLNFQWNFDAVKNGENRKTIMDYFGLTDSDLDIKLTAKKGDIQHA